MEYEITQPLDRIRRLRDPLVVREQPFGVQRSNASARIAFS